MLFLFSSAVERYYLIQCCCQFVSFELATAAAAAAVWCVRNASLVSTSALAQTHACQMTSRRNERKKTTTHAEPHYEKGIITARHIRSDQRNREKKTGTFPRRKRETETERHT